MTREKDEGPSEAAVREMFAGEGDRLSVNRLSELLGQRRETTYQMLIQGEIPAFRLPNDRWLILTAAVVRWLIDRRNSPTPDDDARSQE